MFVTKRSGKKEKVNIDKISARIKKFSYDLDTNFVDIDLITFRTQQAIYDNITTVELDNIASEICASFVSEHPDYSKLAARLIIANLHKETLKSFSKTCKLLYEYINPKTNKHAPLLSEEAYKFIKENSEELDSAIIYDRDFSFDFFAYKTLEKSYLLRINKKIAERPQHMLMRVSVGLHSGNLEAVIQMYNSLSTGLYIHGTPCLFNSATPKPQMSSCFLLQMKDDSIDGIFDTLKQCALISKHAGGIGVAASNIRATGSYINGTNGHSNGLVPLLKVFNSAANYVDQGYYFSLYTSSVLNVFFFI
jgi:ribonucleotide reductase alpha subunit